MDRGILYGIRIVDFTRVLAGPYATRILGDFGAEVIRGHLVGVVEWIEIFFTA
jgi:crotonobetainyl-CoA:carnitine CoA-transferase CaiB-like acyl-CoA transferase